MKNLRDLKFLKNWRDNIEKKRATLYRAKEKMTAAEERAKPQSQKDLEKLERKMSSIEEQVKRDASFRGSAIEIKAFTKVFKSFFAVKDATFNVSSGVIHGFLGPNGSGKTTTIKCLIGAERKSYGNLKVFGKVAGSVEAKSTIGYIPEAARFPKHMNSIEYLINMAKLSGVEPNAAYEIVKSILESMGLWKFRYKKPIFFSSGMQKKMLLAQAMINDPKLLILDEPAENLDPTTRAQLYNELVRLKDLGKTIFISSHVLAELNDIVQEITILRFGKVLFSGKTDTIASSGLSTYRIITNDNDKLIILLNKQGFSCKETDDGVIIKIESESQNYIIQNIIYQNSLYIKEYVQAKKSLQDVYDSLVTENDFSSPEDKGGKGEN
ncbi:MAG: ATP-binding cassette domain-containing protein [Mycoplasma sp.]